MEFLPTLSSTLPSVSLTPFATKVAHPPHDKPKSPPPCAVPSVPPSPTVVIPRFKPPDSVRPCWSPSRWHPHHHHNHNNRPHPPHLRTPALPPPTSLCCLSCVRTATSTLQSTAVPPAAHVPVAYHARNDTRSSTNALESEILPHMSSALI